MQTSLLRCVQEEPNIAEVTRVVPKVCENSGAPRGKLVARRRIAVHLGCDGVEWSTVAALHIVALCLLCVSVK